MQKRGKIVTFKEYGEPGQVLQVEEIAVPSPPFGQVRVRVLLRPINPSDMMTVRGLYGQRPTLPATPGYEGMGVIEEVGPGLGLLRRFLVGKRVLVLGVNPRNGTWQEYVLTPPLVGALPVSARIRDEYAAMFLVNPGAALAMVREVLKVPRHAWLLQTAAGSAVGHIVIQLGKLYGFRTINVIRHSAQAQELKALGADEVIAIEEEDLLERVQAITGGKGVRYAIDAVGGELGSKVIETLGEGGHVLLFGALDGQSEVRVDVRSALFKSHRVEGFWLSSWVRQNPLKFLRVYLTLSRLFSQGKLTIPVGQIFPLEQIQEAVQHAEMPARGGKVLLDSRGHE